MTPLEAVLFDMDGVLVNSEPVHIEAWAEVLPPLGIDVAGGWLKDWAGIPDRDLSHHLCTEHGLAVDPEALLENKRAAYLRRMREARPLFPGVREGIARIAEALAPTAAGRAPLAVATSSDRKEAVAVLEAVAILDAFAFLLAGDEVTRHKPAPEPYLRVAAHLGADPARCVVLEDTPTGVAAGCAAGCTVLAVAGTFPPDALAEADRVFPTTAEAIGHVLGRLAPTAPRE